jgi:hypothetical protein
MINTVIINKVVMTGSCDAKDFNKNVVEYKKDLM